MTRERQALTMYRDDLSGKTDTVTFPDSEQVRYTYYPGSDLMAKIGQK